jgi:prepilin-type N-terminal cleavage/methylation domain-containing protein
MRKHQRGSTLLETVVALALLGIISAAFLSGLATTSTARADAAERSTAKIFAENLMEQIKKSDFAADYSAIVTVPDEFAGYTPLITAVPGKNGSIQKITISVSRAGQVIYSLETYKTDRLGDI